MIDLNRKRYLDPIARKWLGWVREFFDTVHTRSFKPSLDCGGRIITFPTYRDKLQRQCKDAVKRYAAGNQQIEDYCWLFLCSLWKDFDAIILATPAQMEKMRLKWNRRKPWALEILAELSDVLTGYYETVAKKYGHILIEELGIKTCPYCNRQFIQSFKGIRSERPELDHFLPKKENPVFCLSFYNLIPACHGCNHEKLEDKLLVNPYDRGFASKFVIIDKNKKALSKSKIYRLTEKEIGLKFDNPSVEEAENIRVLGLENVYNKHTDYVKELIDKSMAYDAHARKALVESFQGAGYHPRQVYDFVWGRHLMPAEYEDRPLSKLTKDLLEQLGIRR